MKTAGVMEKIRALFDASINIHCWIRPMSVNAPGSERHSKNYNRFIGSRSKTSGHIFGQAVDFHVSGKQGPEQCQLVREEILPHLEDWEIRMEDKDGGWVHIDTKPVGAKRFFKP